MKTKIQTALDIVAESRPRMNGYTAEERAALERIGRQRISEGAKATLRQTVYGRRIAKMLEMHNVVMSDAPSSTDQGRPSRQS